MCALQRGAKERQGKWSSPSLALEDGSGLGLGVADGTRGAWDVCFEWRSQSGSVRVCFVEPWSVLGLSLDKLHTAAL